MISKNLGNNNKKFPYFKKGQFSTASLTGWIIFFSLNSKTEKKIQLWGNFFKIIAQFKIFIVPYLLQRPNLHILMIVGALTHTGRALHFSPWNFWYFNKLNIHNLNSNHHEHLWFQYFWKSSRDSDLHRYYWFTFEEIKYYMITLFNVYEVKLPLLQVV